MQWLGGLGLQSPLQPSKLNPPLSLLWPGSIQYGSSHDKLKVKVDAETERWQSGGLLFDSIFGRYKGLTGHANQLILTSAPCVNPPW